MNSNAEFSLIQLNMRDVCFDESLKPLLAIAGQLNQCGMFGTELSPEIMPWLSACCLSIVPCPGGLFCYAAKATIVIYLHSLLLHISVLYLASIYLTSPSGGLKMVLSHSLRLNPSPPRKLHAGRIEHLRAQFCDI